MPDGFSPVYTQWAQIAQNWRPVLFQYAQGLFMILATIDFGLGAIHQMLGQQSHDNLAMWVFKRILWYGFSYAILLYSATWLPSIINSFVQAGATASGLEGGLDPASVFGQGLNITAALLQNMLWSGLTFKFNSLFALGLAVVICFFSFAAIAVALALALMESYVVLGGGVFLLGFLPFSGTSAIAERYLSYVIGCGIRLFTIYLVCGAGSQLGQMWLDMVNSANFMNDLMPSLSVAGGSLLFAVAAWGIPSLAASLASGAVHFGVEQVIHTTRMASSVSMGALSAPIAIAGGAVSSAAVAAKTALNIGGASGVLKGMGAGAGALTKEAASASVPRLARMQQNLAARAANVK